MKKIIILLLVGVALLGCRNEYTEELKRKIWKMDRDIEFIEKHYTDRYKAEIDSTIVLMKTDNKNFYIHEYNYKYYKRLLDEKRAEIKEIREKQSEYRLEIKKHTHFYDRNFDYEKERAKINKEMGWED